MNHDIIVTSNSNFTFIEKAYVPNTTFITTIAEELINLMAPYYGKPVPKFKLVNNIKFDSPQTLSTYDEIHICCMDVHWAQISFQFCHEFCHLMIGKPVVQDMRWFEESVAELSCRFFMEKFSSVWKDKGILGEPEFSHSINEYVQDRFSSFEGPLLDIPGSILKFWESLTQFPYNREYNLRIANTLYPIFTQYPDFWKIVPLLGNLTKQQNFTDYLRQWAEFSDSTYQAPFQQLFAAFILPCTTN